MDKQEEKNEIQEKLWTIKEVANYLQCAEQTVRDKTSKGEIPNIKIPNGGVRYRKEDIDKWLIERNVKAEKEQ